MDRACSVVHRRSPTSTVQKSAGGLHPQSHGRPILPKETAARRLRLLLIHSRNPNHREAPAMAPAERIGPAQIPKSGQSWRSQDRSPPRSAGVIAGAD